ncbi:MAG TPA: hypothetical protein VNW92_26410 [Polyangiaceae bacterium]|nr:hypothetical protein [Polyangiaceae bacterium]
MTSTEESSAVQNHNLPWESPLSSPNSGLRARLREALTGLTEADDAALVLEDLQAAAAEAGHTAELAAAYAEQLSSARSPLKTLLPVQRLEAYLQAAWVCGEEEGQQASTLAAVLAALDISAADERALALAEPLLLGAEEYVELANRYAQAALSALTEERARQLLERGLHLLSPLLGSAPALMGLNERLARLGALRRSSFPPPAADSSLLEAQLRRALESEDLATRRESRARLGELLIAHGRAAEGLSLWLPELSHSTDLADLDLLERLCEQAEDRAALERVLLRRAELDGPPPERARALEALGGFYGERAGDGDAERAANAFIAAGAEYLAQGAVDDAEHAYELLLNVVPTHVSAAAKLLRLRAKAGDFTRVAEAFGIVLRGSEDASAAAELLLEIEPDAARARAADEFSELVEDLLWRLAGNDQRQSELLLRGCARLFSDAVRHDEAAEAYRRLISEHAQDEDARAFEALIDSHPASDWRRHQRRWLFEWREGRSTDKLGVLLAWAEVEEREWGDPGAALSVLERAAALGVDRQELWQRLARLRLASGNVDAGLAAIERLRAFGVELCPELLAAVLEQRPATRWALDRLKLILSAEQRFSELLELYDRALGASAEPAEQALLLDEAAIAARDVAGNNERAIGYWERYLVLLPNEARVDQALERLYERGGFTQQLLVHLMRRAEHSEGSARVALERRIVELALGSRAFSQAIVVLEHMLTGDPSSASEFMERLVNTHGAAEPAGADASAEAEARTWALATLKAHYAATERPAQLARLLRLELESELSTEARRVRLAELSRLYERELADLGAAFDTQLVLFRLDPSKERERKRLEKLARKPSRLPALCDAYVEIAAACAEGGVPGALLTRAYQLARETLNDSERAIAIARKLLARLANQHGEERRVLHLELASLLEAAGQQAAAQSELSLLARHYPTDGEVLFRSARAAGAAEAWEEAERSLRSLLLILHGGARENSELTRSAVYVELSQIKRRVADEPAALELLDFAFEAALTDETEARGLELALRQSGHLDLLERACFQRLTLAGSPSALARGLAELGSLRPGQALPAEMQAAATRSAERLADALERENTEPALAGALPQALEACVRWLPAERARQLLARHQEHLGGVEREALSVALAARLLAVPDYRAEALDRLEGVARRGELPAATWNLLAAAWEATGDTEKLRWALTSWLEREPENAVALAKALELALQAAEISLASELFARLTQASLPAVEAQVRGRLRRELQQACARAGDHEPAARLLLAELPELKDNAKRAALLAEAGELWQRAGNARAAREAAEQAHVLDPGLCEATLLLARLARDRDERELAVSLLSTQLAGKDRRRGKALSRALRLLADLELERDELSEALAHLIEAHQLDKTDLDTALVLGLLAMDLDRFDTAASALRAILAQRELGTWASPSLKSSYLAQTCFQLARIEHHYGRKNGAKRMVARALEEDPESAAARHLLTTLDAS